MSNMADALEGALEGAASPNTVRKANADLLKAVKDQRVNCWDIVLPYCILPTLLVLAVAVYGWCGLFQAYPCNGDLPHPDTAEVFRILAHDCWTGIISLGDVSMFMMNENNRIIQKAWSLGIWPFTVWMTDYYIPSLGTAFAGLILLNVISIFFIGMVWTLFLVCVTGSCRFCRLRETKKKTQ
jgi:hypothetical protein